MEKDSDLAGISDVETDTRTQLSRSESREALERLAKRALLMDLVGLVVCITGVVLNWVLGFAWGISFFAPGVLILILALVMRFRVKKYLP